jgi:HSP20 family molecular chaperone IbpA
MGQTGQILSIGKSESIREEMEAREARIRERAYSLFQEHGLPGKALEDWLTAEGELARRPSIELRELDSDFVLSVAVPGVDPRAIKVEVTPEEILVKASPHQYGEELGGFLYETELRGGDLFRAVRLPKRILPDTVSANVENGMLQVIAGIATDMIRDTSEEMSDSHRVLGFAA